jgi:Tfp pilus assembly protein FimT
MVKGPVKIATVTNKKSSTSTVSRCLSNTIDTLCLFNEKAEKLNRLSFTSFVRNNTLSFSAWSRDGQVGFSATGPSEEATDAFVLTLRFFVQDSESISIRNMAKLYSSLPLFTLLVTAMHEKRNNFNTFLDAPSGVVWQSEKLTNRRVFHVFSRTLIQAKRKSGMLGALNQRTSEFCR